MRGAAALTDPDLMRQIRDSEAAVAPGAVVSLDDETRTVTVLAVAHRADVYRAT